MPLEYSIDRLRPERPGRPCRADARVWRQRLDELGEPHGGIITGHRGGPVLVGLHDPDGIEIRLYDG